MKFAHVRVSEHFTFAKQIFHSEAISLVRRANFVEKSTGHPVFRAMREYIHALPLTSELDALCAQVCEPDSAACGGRAHSDGGVVPPKQKHPCWGALF